MGILIETAGPQDLAAVTELYGAVCDYLADKPFNPGWRRDAFPSGEEAARRGAEALRLYVWEGNGPAVRAYEKSGFVRLGREDIGLGEFGLDGFYLYEKRLDR